METLYRMLDHLCRSRHVTVVIKDFTGQMLKTPEIAPLVSHFLLHDNRYCLLVKSAHASYLHCVMASHRSLYEKITSASDPSAPFWGVCHGGVREYVIPLLWHDKTVIGAMIVGCYPCDAARAAQSHGRLAAKYGLDAAALADAYSSSIGRYPPPEEEVLTSEFALCARYFERLCEQYIDSPRFSALTANPSSTNSKSSRLEFALHYIKTNLDKHLTVDEIAAACCCSPSSLAHLFSEATGQGVIEYILNQRIALAASLLTETSLSVTAIAARCGFSSQKYFSEMFRRRKGMSPMAWRTSQRDNSTSGGKNT